MSLCLPPNTATLTPRQLGSHPSRFALGCEDDAGNVEYKLQILPSPTRFTRLVTQLNWRLAEGMGTCYYELGVMDDGSPLGVSYDDMRSSLDNLCAMANRCHAKAKLQWIARVYNGCVQVTTRCDEAAALLALQDAGSELPNIRELDIELHETPQALSAHATERMAERVCGGIPGDRVTGPLDNGGSTVAMHITESQSGRLTRLAGELGDERVLAAVATHVDITTTERLLAEVRVSSSRTIDVDYML